MSPPGRATVRWLVARLPPGARVAVARAVWRARAALGSPALPVPRGASGRADRPGVLVVALGAAAEEVERLAAALAAAQRRTGARVLLVVDTDAFAPLRAVDLPVEYVPPRRDWEAHVGGGPYDRFVAARLRAILHAYRPERVIESSAVTRLASPTLDALLS